jgi:predicted nucleic acid-binding Zn ribbon protein
VSTDIKSLSQLLNEVLKKYELDELVEKNILIEKFKEIVGKQLADRIEFKNFDRGILTIEVESSAWKNEIFLLREQIVEKINKEFGKQIVKQLKIL